MLGSIAREHYGCTAEVKMKFTKLIIFFRMVRMKFSFAKHWMKWLTSDCVRNGVLNWIFQGVVRQSFYSSMFRLLRHMHCNPLLALLSIPWLADSDWDVTGVEWFLIEYERSRFIFILPFPGRNCKRADGTNSTEGWNGEIFPVFHGELNDRNTSRDCTEWPRLQFLENNVDYTEYPMFVELDHVSGYQNSLFGLEGPKGNLTLDTDSNKSNILKGVIDNDDRNFDGL